MSDTTQKTTGAVMVERNTYNALIEERNALRSILAALLGPSEETIRVVKACIYEHLGVSCPYHEAEQIIRAAVAAAEKETSTETTHD